MRYHVQRTEWSPTTGLRKVILTRQAARPGKAPTVFANAVRDTIAHMARGGLVEREWLTDHHCPDYPVCPDPTGHVYALWWRDDPVRLTTLRLVER